MKVVIDTCIFVGALYAEAGAILVTGNIKHFPREAFVVSPAEFLENYAQFNTLNNNKIP